MTVQPGSFLGVYEILAPLGAGGMGEVYRARDTTLGREVAIKVLPDAPAEDSDRLARFEREAKSLATLNHPHIATLFGMEQSGGRRLLVMELVDGEDLAHRLLRGPMTVPEALAVARQIADALDAAHEHGIIHRDLKPANIRLTPDAVVKVLDFGLAKPMARPGSASGSIADSPTLTVMSTGAGVILGTAAYMSPEQAKGLPVDQRTDVFSFGCVLYEMLTGQRAFAGETVTDILASIVAREPDWTALPSPLDPRLSRLLQRCLAKSRRQRWQAIGDVRAEIEFIVAEPGAAATAATHPSVPRPLWVRAWPVAGMALAAAIAGWAAWTSKPSPRPPIVRFPIVASPQSALQMNFNRQLLAVSPDGRQIAYSAERVYLRSISDTAAQPIPGTDGFTSTTHPAFSPDGRSIVFWTASDRTLKRVTLGSAAVATLCPLQQGGYGLSWSGNHIYFGDTGDIKRVSANGGEAEVVVPQTEREAVYGPQLLPDGDTLLFTLGKRVMASWDEASIVVQSLRTKDRMTLVERATAGQSLPTGHLVFARGGVLFAVPLDLTRSAIVGEPIAVVEGVRFAAPGTTGAAHFAVSDSGTLAYIPGPVSSAQSLQMALFDQAGNADPVSVPLGPYSHPRVSGDGTRAAVGVDDGKQRQVWIYGLAKTGASRRLTFDGDNQFAEWSPDDQRVAFQSTREGDAGIWWQRADGTDTAKRLTRPPSGVAHVPQSFSPDGQHLLFDQFAGDQVTLWDLTIADGTVTPLRIPESDVPSDATFSRDGRWFAYSVRARDPAQAVIYMEPFPPTGARYQVSRQQDDAHHPVWSRDGRQLHYTPGPGNRLLAVPVLTAPTVAFGSPVEIPRLFVNAPPTSERTYDMTRDGRFLGLRMDVGPDGRPVGPEMQVVLNWFDELRQRVPIR